VIQENDLSLCPGASRQARSRREESDACKTKPSMSRTRESIRSQFTIEVRRSSRPVDVVARAHPADLSKWDKAGQKRDRSGTKRDRSGTEAGQSGTEAGQSGTGPILNLKAGQVRYLLRRFCPSDLTQERQLDCGQFFAGDRSADRPIPCLIVSQFPSSAQDEIRALRIALNGAGNEPRNAPRSPPETTCTAPGKHGPIPHIPGAVAIAEHG
jgi:hypothetical protein